MHSYKGGPKPFNVYARTRFVCECVYIKSMSTDFGLLEKKVQNTKQIKWFENQGEKRCDLIFFTTMMQRDTLFHMFN